LGNLRWYLTDALPGALTWPLFLLALGGVAYVLWRRRRPRELLLIAFCGVYLVAISASRQHWQRYLIEILPIALLFGALLIDRITDAVARSHPRQIWLTTAIPVVVVAALVVAPVRDLVAVDRRDRQLTQREE